MRSFEDIMDREFIKKALGVGLKSIGKKLKSVNITTCIVLLMSVVAYVSLYGVKFLNPVYVEWMLGRGDLTQQYLGWKAFRYSRWFFPIGNLDTLLWPDQTSVIFTDSIPILAVPFKILSPILPHDFQYFGWYGFASFILIGYFSKKILSEYIENKVYLVISTIPFIFSLVMIHRMYGHTTLSAHWILLLAFEVLFSKDRFEGRNEYIRRCVLLGYLCGSIHMYFVPMCGMILIADVFWEFFRKDNLKEFLANRMLGLVFYVFMALFSIWIYGGFYQISHYKVIDTSVVLGQCSMNLNALFNPRGRSVFLPDLGEYGGGQYEGFAYLGLGMIIAMFVAIAFGLYSRVRKKTLSIWKIGFIKVLTACTLELFFALSPKWTAGSRVILDLYPTNLIFKVWATFRSTGRFAWPIVYAVMLVSVILIYDMFCKHRNWAVTIIVLIVCVQITDIHLYLSNIKDSFSHNKYKQVLQDTSFWNAVGKDDRIKHIVFVGWPDGAFDYLLAITDWCIDNHKTQNWYYWGRQPAYRSVEISCEALTNPNDSYLFVFCDGHKVDIDAYDCFNYYETDNVILGYTGEYPPF